VLFMDGGVVVEEGPPEEVIGNPKEERTRTFLARVLDPTHVRAGAEDAAYAKRHAEDNGDPEGRGKRLPASHRPPSHRPNSH